MLSAPSIVKMHNQSYTLTAPVSAVTDWDATVAFTGVLSEIGLNPGVLFRTAGTDSFNTYDHAALLAGVPYGSFVIKAGAAGTVKKVGAAIANDTNVAFGACEVSPDGDRCRLIAVALEVTNTTAEIYKQGSITVATLPAAVDDYGMVHLYDVNAAPWEHVGKQSIMPAKLAATRGALIAVPGATTWAAKDGVYMIPRMVAHTAALQSPAHNYRMVVAQDSEDNSLYAMTQPTSNGLDGALKWPVFHGVSASGFSAQQVFFNGLSHESSLTITMRTIVEYFPSFNSPLMQLTSPSPAFCPKAFEIYSRTCQMAPYAVPVTQNPGGEYFRKVLRFVADACTAIAPLSGSFAPLLGSVGAASAGLQYVLSARASREKVKKGKAPPLPPRVRKDEAGARSMATRKK